RRRWTKCKASYARRSPTSRRRAWTPTWRRRSTTCWRGSWCWARPEACVSAFAEGRIDGAFDPLQEILQDRALAQMQIDGRRHARQDGPLAGPGAEIVAVGVHQDGKIGNVGLLVERGVGRDVGDDALERS